MTNQDSPIKRLERQQQETIQQLKTVDKLSVSIAELEAKHEDLKEQLNAEVTRLIEDENVSPATLRALGVTVPARRRKKSTTTDEQPAPQASGDFHG